MNVRRYNRRLRREGGWFVWQVFRLFVALALFVVAAVAAVGWLWWRSSSRSPASQSTSVTMRSSAAPDGALIVPVTDKSGRPAEPMVLVPVNSPGTSRTASATNVASPRPPAPSARTNPPAGLPEIPNFDEKVLAVQVALARRGISSGSFDGVVGSQTRTALRAFQRCEGLPESGALDAATQLRLYTDVSPYTNYVVTAEDLARLLPLGATWLEKSQQERLDYETVLELIAERTQSNPKLVRALNPAVDWSRVSAGASLKVLASALPDPAKAASVRISIGARTLQAFDAAGTLLAHFPCSIAARVEKRPVGEQLQVIVVAPNPNYTFDPEVFPESAEARQLGRKLILQPGPNNPVGVAWIGLDKPGYGIHGTPRPEEVGRTESHGCFRLANWNAEHLLKLVTAGTPVFVDP